MTGPRSHERKERTMPKRTSVRYWRTKTFRTRELYRAWIAKNRHRHQIVEVFVCNAYAVDYRPLLILL